MIPSAVDDGNVDEGDLFSDDDDDLMLMSMMDGGDLPSKVKVKQEPDTGWWDEDTFSQVGSI